MNRSLGNEKEVVSNVVALPLVNRTIIVEAEAAPDEDDDWTDVLTLTGNTDNIWIS